MTERRTAQDAQLAQDGPDGFSRTLSVGSGALVAALASLLTCYSSVVGHAVFGIQDALFNPHFQAVLMWGLVLAALVYLFRDRRNHGGNVPLALGGVAFLTLVGTLYVSYDQQVEAAAYVLLIIATFLNQNLLLAQATATVQEQGARIADLNSQLAERISTQETQIGRLARLRHFLAPQIADLVVGDGRQDLLRSHRRYIACMFCDVRNFTALSEEAEPEEVMSVLERFHDNAGARVADRGGTIGFRSGDGLMVFFNDPVECKDPVLDAVRAAWEIRASFRDIQAPWTRRGHQIGLGIGIASGFATMGLMGLRGRTDYTAIGSVVNAASRLCDAAQDGQILMSQRAMMDLDDRVQASALPPMTLKGFAKPVEVVSVQAVEGMEDM